jgi:hypothetical protein
MIENADKSNFAIAIGSYSYFTLNEEILAERYTFPNIVDSNNLVEILCNPGLWRWAFKREILEGVHFSKNRMGEDQQYLIEIDAFTRPKYFYKKIVYQYMINQKMQLTNNPIAIRDLSNTISEIKTLIDRKYDFVQDLILLTMPKTDHL